MKYDLSYYEGMLKNYSHTAEQIAKIRWEFVDELQPKTVLDYGSGVGWFRVFNPNGCACDTYDIMPVPQTGIRHDSYDLVCFWDVLEHVPNLSMIGDIETKAVALTVPVKPDDVELKTWKHFKPGEHLHYFDKNMMDELMGYYGFTRTKDGTPECPPRTDIWSAIYQKNKL